MPASMATSSRRRPATRRTPVTRTPASSGRTRALLARRNSPIGLSLMTATLARRRAAILALSLPGSAPVAILVLPPPGSTLYCLNLGGRTKLDA
ncbi:hypothetical protein Ate02nite_48350 [Paractinoplanes tereljensis]|uniref:Uncharacterized protein n=1 Tax=Paractinoplanes tereljensis TaxID=571912 RepID=A0A919NNI8_9ACTN|nr:hypothetical protein Ate02nite_48350 [Actinoplanes tereljensis]